MTTANPKANPGEIVATVRDVTVTYDGYLTRALSRVNLDFRRGEITGVLGARGAGKSTVLKILAGRLRPTEGAVKVFGRSSRGGASKARVGYLPGKVDLSRPPGFFCRLFGKKNEASPAGRKVTRLTQAFLGNRDLLILDDPFAGLEPAELLEAKTLLREMVAKGKTVILSSDSLMEVKDICERLVILDEGKVQAVGTLKELLDAGDAIRFLPAILPSEIVGRVLKILREEIFGDFAPSETLVPPLRNSSSKPSSEAVKAPADQRLSSLTRATESKSPSVPKTDDPIDHEKLEELTKIKKPE